MLAAGPGGMRLSLRQVRTVSADTLANTERLAADARAYGLEREARAIWCDAFAGVTEQGGSVDEAAVAADLACRAFLDVMHPHLGRNVRGGVA